MSATPVALQIYENFSNKRSFELLFLQIYYFLLMVVIFTNE